MVIGSRLQRGAVASLFLRRGLALWLPICLCAGVALAVVTITGFAVEAGDSEIFVNWETASEIDNLGFYVWRSQTETSGYVKLPLDAPPSTQTIPSLDEGIGAFYEFVDVQVTPGIRYYYKIEDLPASGGSEMVGPLSAMIPLPATDTPTPGPPTPTPTPDVRFWADPAQVTAGSCSTVFWQTENVRAVYFDGVGVSGEGARAFCPCFDQMYVLRVEYRDGRSEEFTVTIRVTGTCGSGTVSSPLATPTLLSTSTAPWTIAPSVAGGTSQPTATPRPAATPIVTRPQVSPVDTPTMVAALTDAGEGVLASPLATPMPLTMVTGASGAMPGGSTVEAESPSRLPTLWMGLVLALAAGSALMVGGLWLWKRGA